MLTFYNYKEPLKPVESENGYGYYGVLLATKNGEKIQCHVCGELYSSLSMHIRNHGYTGKEYKNKFGLSSRTALVSDQQREILKRAYIKRFGSWSSEKKEEMKRKRLE